MNRNSKAKRTLICALVIAGIILAAFDNANADFVFGEPVNLGPNINSSLHEAGAIISLDDLSMFFSRHVTWNENEEYWLAARATKEGPWETPENYGPWDYSLWNRIDVCPNLTTADGLELYFSDSNDNRPDGYGYLDIWMMERESIDAEWGPAINIGPTINTKDDEWWPVISPDGLELYFCGYSASNVRPGDQGGSDLWMTRRATRNDPWSEPVNLGPAVNSRYGDTRPMLSADGHMLFFDSSRPGGYGSRDLYMTKRKNLSDPWGEAMNLGSTVNSPVYEECAYISPDGSTLYLDCERPGSNGGHDIWQVSVEPIADFDGDGIVGLEDISILIDNWGKDEPSVDIGPMPWGDGVVDVSDMEVLVSHWGQQVGTDDPKLVARWKLDETEGTLAFDDIGNNDGTLYGEPLWQPVGGRLDGALQFDGIDDYMETDFVHDPSKGSFSVRAWIKGGAPGQVIISQADTSTETPVGTVIHHGSVWLGTDPIHGRLMTGLMQKYFPTLESESVITDSQWHLVSLVYDFSTLKRHLYADGVEVAKDTDGVGGVSSYTGLYIGVGPALEEGTFWSGLIDDVRITDPAKRNEPTVKQDSTGFEIYADQNTPDMFVSNSISQGELNCYDQIDPMEGSYCIYCTGLAQYNSIGFDFWPDRDLTRLVQEGYSLEFWVRSDSPGSKFDVRFLDTKTDDPADHPWRMRKTIDEKNATWDGQWQFVRIPLRDFTEHGSWDNNTWFGPQGRFDWAAIDGFQIVTEHHDFKDKQFWFDDIRITE
ncbi:MAG: hypothetical protein E4H40_04350 [Candidatus Brocadiia bacterium]|nr:MAG: hypothetical protein E4H40_04350 [Candidatus Brocadiia bacterium]